MSSDGCLPAEFIQISHREQVFMLVMLHSVPDTTIIRTLRGVGESGGQGAVMLIIRTQ